MFTTSLAPRLLLIQEEPLGWKKETDLRTDSHLPDIVPKLNLLPVAWEEKISNLCSEKREKKKIISENFGFPRRTDAGGAREPIPFRSTRGGL